MSAAVLPDLIAALSEVYQPLYGQPELSAAAVRGCEDRLDQVAAVHDTLQRLLGRPPRVLDLGCAQGYFSLHLAARGASVEGIDADAPSIAVCQHLAGLHPELDVSFRVARVEDILSTLAPERYDLILGLSILHHLARAHGAERVRHWLALASQRAEVLVLELALRAEPLDWAPALPEDPRALLADIAFVHELARYPTHLSPIARPLFVASNRDWLLPPLAGRIDSHDSDPHALARDHYQGSRHYYSSGERFIKVFRYDVDPALDNPGELAREAAFLKAPPPGLRLPALQAFGGHEHAGWLVRERLPGTLLLDHLQDSPPPEHRGVVRDVLDQLVCLEDAGLYHNDLRIWNLLLQDDGRVLLLDYGAITARASDRAWPGDPYLAFFILIHELVTGEVARPEPLRPAAISPWRLPPPYRDWAAGLWELPLDQWSFRRMRERLAAALAARSGTAPAVATPHQRWSSAIEQAIDIQTRFMSNQRWEREQQARLLQLTQDYARLEAWSRELKQALSERDRQREQIEQQAAAAERQAEQRVAAAEQAAREALARAEAAEAWVAGLRASLYWRLTAPVRWLIVQPPRLLARLGARIRRLPGALRRGLFALVRRAIRLALARPWLKTPALRLLSAAPALRGRLKQALLRGADAQPVADADAMLAPPVARARRALRRHASQPDD